MTVNPRRRSWFVLGIALCVSSADATQANATQVVDEPFLGVRHIHQVETTPRPLNINVVEIDLSAPGLSFQVTPGGPHPRPIGSNGLPMETIRQTPRQFANVVGAQIAINGSFYSAQTIGGVLWANNVGLTASNGDKYSTWETLGTPNFDDALNITQDNQATIVKMDPPLVTGYETDPVVPLHNAVTGSHRLVANGVNVAPPPGSDNLTLIHPRTAVGVTADNKLLLITVDGRQPGFSEGVNLLELAGLMLSHGAADAINLDGGGSTQMVMNYFNDSLTAQLVNSPSEAERLVGTNLAVFALPNGDYNQDGTVDAADYVVWRKSIGGSYAYDAWKAHFGSTTGSGAAPVASLAVPEPSVWAIVAVAAWGFVVLRPVSTPLAFCSRVGMGLGRRTRIRAKLFGVM